MHFVVYAPVGTATFQVRNDGWDATTHKIHELTRITKMLVAYKTADPEKTYQELTRDDSSAESVEPQHITIGEYMRLAGMEERED